MAVDMKINLGRSEWSTRVAIWLVLSGPVRVSDAASLTQRADAHAVPLAVEEEVSVDPLFKEPYIDIDEWRDVPVRHRYVHGGFRGTQTRFSFYFPPKDQYQGRFVQHITPVPDNENLAQKVPPGEYNKVGFSIASGAYFIETNGGGHLDLGKAAGPQADSTITAYRANAAAAQYSRAVAMKIYEGGRPFGYAYGGSGGAYRTIGSIENTRGVWDGVVPYVMGSPMAIPNVFSVRMHAMRILKDKFPQIIDAVEPGGSGDPYAGLNEEEAAAFREVTRMGFPPESWFGYKTMGIHGFSALYQGVVMADPSYFTDFWTKRGYYGFDHPESFEGARLQIESKVASLVTVAEAVRLRINLDASTGEDRGGVDTAFRVPLGEEAQRVVGFRLAEKPPKIEIMGADLIVQTGEAAGNTLPVSRIVDGIVVLGTADKSIAAKIAAGDTVRVDNSNFLAAQTYHRHQVPGSDYVVWDQFRGPDGKPLYPQRPMLLGPLFTKSAAGSLQSGVFEGKMIVVESLWDREAFPWQADWYRSLVKKHLGEKADDHFRLWYTDHALHGDERKIEDQTRVIAYEGVLHQALRDLSAWVENGVEPPASTSYRIEDGQVVVPDSAEMRKGIQPVVHLQANGGVRAEVEVGEPVAFIGSISVPPGAGYVIAAEWDFEGSGEFPAKEKIADCIKAGNRINVRATHAFSKPGTYFVALRGTSQREGDVATPYACIRNLDRVRVVVK